VTEPSTDAEPRPTIREIRAGLAAIAVAHHQIEASVAALDPERMRQPSRLPGWSRAHVVAHLANNAMAFVGMLTGVMAGELVAQYPGGDEQRAVDIEARSTLRPLALGALLSSAHVQFEAAASALDDERWYAPSDHRGIVRPAWCLVWSRWREAEVHHIDLGADHGIDDWSDAFVDLALGAERRCLARRLPPDAAADGDIEVTGSDAQLLWWLMGREGAEVEVRVGGRPLSYAQLTPWGDAGWMPGVPGRW
jgi:maleylpyruvate isomerase